jgi:hypothetical protein
MYISILSPIFAELTQFIDFQSPAAAKRIRAIRVNELASRLVMCDALASDA